MGYWMRNHWYACAMVVLAVVAITAIIIIRSDEFHPQDEYTTTVANTPDAHSFEFIAGQEFRARCILSYAKDEDVTLCMTEVAETAEGDLIIVGMPDDFGNRGDCEVITFEVPHTGTYALEVGSASMKSLHVTVQYSLE